MTTDNKTTLYDRIAKVTEAVGSFPDSIPAINSVVMSSNHVRLYIHRDYTGSRSAEFRKVAELAASFSVPVNIEKDDFSTRKRIRVEFERLGVRFKCENNIDTPAARAMAKALGRKLTAEPLVITVSEFLKAIQALESA